MAGAVGCQTRDSLPGAPHEAIDPQVPIGALSNELRDALILAGPNTRRIVFSNTAANALVESSARDLQGRLFESLVVPGARERVLEAFGKIASEKDAHGHAPNGVGVVEVASNAGQAVEVEMWLARGESAQFPVTHILAMFRGPAQPQTIIRKSRHSVRKNTAAAHNSDARIGVDMPPMREQSLDTRSSSPSQVVRIRMSKGPRPA